MVSREPSSDNAAESPHSHGFTRKAKPSRRMDTRRRSVALKQPSRADEDAPAPGASRPPRQSAQPRNSQRMAQDAAKRPERADRSAAETESRRIEHPPAPVRQRMERQALRKDGQEASQRGAQVSQRGAQAPHRPEASERPSQPPLRSEAPQRGAQPSRRPEAVPQQSWRSLGITALIALAAVLIIVVSSKGLSLNMPDYASILENNKRSMAAVAERIEAESEGAEAADPVSLTVTFAGDCTLGTDEAFNYSSSFNAMYSLQGPAYFLQNVADIFGSDDLTVVNMEGTLTDSTTRADKTFAFKGDAEYAKVFSSASVEAASMANNHSHDYGDISYDDTLEALDAEGIRTFGYDSIAYMDVKGVKVALVGVYELAENAGIRDEMVERISEAKANGAQLTMVYVHWGVELETVPNDTQMMLGRAAIDAGADLVVGSHPHVIQGWEVYKGCYIVYSLGNFCFGGNDSPTDMDCMMFQQTFTVQGSEVVRDDNVDFIACSVSSASGYNNYQPTPLTGSEKERVDAKIAASSEAIAQRAESFAS